MAPRKPQDPGKKRTGSPGEAKRSSRRSSGRPGRRSGRKVALWLFVVAVLLGAMFLYVRMRGPGEDISEEIPLVDREAAEASGDRAIVLVFPNWDATDYILEQRQLPSRHRIEHDLMAVMGALCEGPTTSGAVSALPRGTRPLAAFYNDANSSIVIDFSREIVVNHPGGSAAESGTLTSILRTVALNFPQVRECQLLVDGAQSETLGGHISLDRPFVPRRWL